ncbi:MAG: PAS domain-containing protein [Candidatus Cloacimonadaceae bacterium]
MDWIKEFPAAITVCDRQGIVIDMNEKACATFADEGGAKLIGHSLQDCHKPESWAKIQAMIATGTANTYTIKKNGIHKLIHQQPWFKNGEVAGVVEMSIELPQEMQHHVR